MFSKTSGSILFLISFLPLLVVARTGLTGCVQTMVDNNLYYIDPCSGEICSTAGSDSSTSYLAGYSVVPSQYYASCGNEALTVVETATRVIMPASPMPVVPPVSGVAQDSTTVVGSTVVQTSTLVHPSVTTVPSTTVIVVPSTTTSFIKVSTSTETTTTTTIVEGPTTTTQIVTATTVTPIVVPGYTGAASVMNPQNLFGVFAAVVAGAAMM